MSELWAQLREREDAQIYAAMWLKVPRAGFNAKPEHVDKLRDSGRWTAEELRDAVNAYVAGGCGIAG